MKRILSWFLALAILLSLAPQTVLFAQAADPANPVIASGSCGADLQWTLTSDGVLTITGTGAMTDYSYDGAPWHAYSDNVREAVVSDGVTSLGEYAFLECFELISVELPETLTVISDYAFFDCYSLSDITLPDNLTGIGAAAFSGCRNLPSITVPEGVTEIRNYAFKDCRNMTRITLPDGVTSIGNNAFWFCWSLTDIALPEGVISIGSWAFSDCTSLRSIVLPKSLASIGDECFTSTDLKDVYYGGDEAMWKLVNIGQYNVDLDNAAIHYNVTDEYSIASGTCGKNLQWSLNLGGTLTITGSGPMTDYPYDQVPWAAYSPRIQEVIASAGVTTIGEYAFFSCTDLTSVELPKSVTGINACAFWFCTSLPSITFPEGLTSIGNFAFSHCGSLQEAVLPESLTSLGEAAFFRCSNLASVTLPGSLTSIGNQAFSDCGSLTSIEVPEGVTTVGNGAFSWCDSLTNITLPRTLTTISEDAFTRCMSLTSITLPEGVTEIALRAFWGCESLTSITLPRTLTHISDSAFGECTSLQDVYYAGDEAMWELVTIGTENECLTGAAIHCLGRPADRFEDIVKSKWYYEAVDYAVSTGLMNGMGDGTFAPNSTMTRAQLAQIFWNLAGKPDCNEKTPFTDVKEGKWYTTAIKWAYAEGIVTGVTANTYGVNGLVTREQVIVMLYRFAKAELAEGDWLSSFHDGSNVHTWAYDALNWAVANGYIAGSNNNLTPRNNMTRAQVAQFFMNYLKETAA